METNIVLNRVPERWVCVHIYHRHHESTTDDLDSSSCNM